MRRIFPPGHISRTLPTPGTFSSHQGVTSRIPYFTNIIMDCYWPVFTFLARCYRRDAMLARYLLSSRVCPSVCPSQVGVVPKWLNTGSRKQRRTIAHGDFSFMLQKICTKFQWDCPQRGAKSRWCSIRIAFLTGREISGSDALRPKFCVHSPRWSASTTYAGGGIIHDDVTDNGGGSWSLLITVTF